MTVSCLKGEGVIVIIDENNAVLEVDRKGTKPVHRFISGDTVPAGLRHKQ